MADARAVVDVVAQQPVAERVVVRVRQTTQPPQQMKVVAAVDAVDAEVAASRCCRACRRSRSRPGASACRRT